MDADLAAARRRERTLSAQSAARFRATRRPPSRTLFCEGSASPRAKATARPVVVDPIAPEERLSALDRVVDAIVGRWFDAGFYAWTATRCENGVALPVPRSTLCDLVPVRLTSPSGKALFGCRGCGVLHLIPRGICRGVLDAGARYEPDEAGLPRPVGGAPC